METEARKSRIIRDSVIGILVNLFIAAAKIIVGLFVSSLAIVSEGLNNAADAGSSFLTLVGAKLSSRHPDKEHPFGYGRIEYLTNLTIAVLILLTGVSLLRDSVDGILYPVGMDINVAAILLVAVSAIVKFLLGTFMVRDGRTISSEALVAVGTEGRNDSFFSLITIAVSILFLTTGLSLDAWAGVLFSAIIIKSGIGILRSTVSDLIGKRGEKDLANKLYKEIRKTPGILNAADMMLHNYGPDSWSGSVNLELNHDKTLGEIYEFLHDLQLRIMHEYNVTMVFGLYAVNNDPGEECELRHTINTFVGQQEHLKSFHALYRSPSTGKIYVDFVVDYELADWEQLKQEFEVYMAEKYPGIGLEITVETEFV